MLTITDDWLPYFRHRLIQLQEVEPDKIPTKKRHKSYQKEAQKLPKKGHEINQNFGPK